MRGLVAYLKPGIQLLGLALLITLSSSVAMAQEWESYWILPGEGPCEYSQVYSTYADLQCGAQASNQTILMAIVGARAKAFNDYGATFDANSVADTSEIAAYAGADDGDGLQCHYGVAEYPDGDDWEDYILGSNYCPDYGMGLWYVGWANGY